MKRNKDGFTLVELAIVIVIIAVLASITLFTYAKVQVNTRDTSRASRVTAITEALEKYYRENGEYPSCAQITQSGSQVSTLLGGLDPSVLVTPTASSSTTNSISTCNDLTAGVGGADTFAYVGDGSTACNTGTACTAYTLEYRKEADGSIISVQAQHLATATPVTAPATPIVSAAMVSTNAVGTAGAVTCNTGTAQYQLRSEGTNTATQGTWSSWSAWSSSQLTATVAASQGYQYGFQAHARCYDGTNTSGTTADSNIATTVRTINTPVAPTYLSPASFTSNVNAVVNYSSSCPAGTSIINGTMRTQAWTGGQWGPNPFGYLDSWENYSGVDKNVEYWGKYQCTTTWSTSAYSPESHNVIVVHP